MAEGPDGNLPVADCARLSRLMSQVLDAADPISGAYVLEVSSPGVDRPLTRPKDFDAFAGLEARLEIDRLSDGRKRFKGEIAGFEAGAVIIRPEGEDQAVHLPFSWIVEAKLVLSQALLARGAAARMARITAPDNS
jgi:ribosome maturation factor RimP